MASIAASAERSAWCPSGSPHAQAFAPCLASTRCGQWSAPARVERPARRCSGRACPAGCGRGTQQAFPAARMAGVTAPRMSTRAASRRAGRARPGSARVTNVPRPAAVSIQPSAINSVSAASTVAMDAQRDREPPAAGQPIARSQPAASDVLCDRPRDLEYGGSDPARSTSRTRSKSAYSRRRHCNGSLDWTGLIEILKADLTAWTGLWSCTYGRREPGARVTPGARSLEPANARFPFGHPSASSSARGFALTAVGTLALTTAATIAVFAVAERRPRPRAAVRVP